MNRVVMISVFILIALGLSVVPTPAFQPPTITLDRVEVANIQPFFAKPKVGFKDANDPGKDLPVGAILNMAYILHIKNPNKEPVMLDEMSFTIAFDGLEVNTAMAYEDSWIPAGKTNEVRVLTANETLPTISSLMVGTQNAARIQELKTSAGEMVKKWWETVGDFAFPITVSAGTATFKDEKGKEVRVTFSGEWPKK